jgi:tetratricopeptide (TPR) repeat protein
MCPTPPEKSLHPSKQGQSGQEALAPKQAMERAFAAFRRGGWVEAENFCRLVLKERTGDFDALHLLGIIAAQSGRLEEALGLLSRAVDAVPGEATAHNSRGNVLRDLGRFPAALESYDRAIAIKPDYHQAHFNRGNSLRDLGRHVEALASYERAIALNPGFTEAHFGRGIAFAATGRNEEAAVSFERAVTLNPGFAEGHFCRGAALSRLGHLRQAVGSYERAIRCKPDFLEAYVHCGNALQDLGLSAQAAACFAQAISLKPGQAEFHNLLGNALRALGRHEQALEQFEHAIALVPDHLEAITNCGVVLLRLERPAQALECFERAIAIKADFALGHCNRGVALMRLDRVAEAIESFGLAIAREPDQVEAHSNLGIALMEQGRHEEARTRLERAIALDPDHAEGQFNLAVCHLLAGDFRAGWEGWEWRWKLKRLAGRKRTFDQPQWRGEHALDGKKILLHAEQGLGDTLQFCRYVEKVKACGATVVLEVQPPLVSLLAGLGGIEQVIGAGDPLPPFDWHCPLMSLPLALGTTANNIPSNVPYIRSSPSRVAMWRERLGDATKPRVGVAWTGNASRFNDRHRSLALAQLEPFLPDGVEWISLQKDVREADLGTLRSCNKIRHFGDELVDFAETAALVELLDLVITVDTSVAHLAGAMGKPTWVLLSFNADWRWLRDREDSPWYPTVRLFRQPIAADWESVMGRVREELERCIFTRGG